MIESYMIYIWLGITVLSLVIEAFTTELISIWVAGGALVALILSAINGVPYYAEIIVFVVLSIILILFTRPMCKKYLMRNERKTNVDTIIGIKCAVTEEITPLKHGKVKIYGVEWTAVSSNGTTIEKDKIVEVLAVDGNKLIVKEEEKWAVVLLLQLYLAF